MRKKRNKEKDLDDAVEESLNKCDGCDGACVTCDGVTTRQEEKRREEKRREEKRREEIKGRAEELAEIGVSKLNHMTGSNFKANSVETMKNLITLAREGVTPTQVERVVSWKVREWKGGDMAKFLVPSTLFRPSKFRTYLEAVESARTKKPKKVEYLT